MLFGKGCCSRQRPQRSGVGPRLCSSRSCLRTAFIAISVCGTSNLQFHVREFRWYCSQHNPHFVVWPLELGLGTHNPRFVAWPLELGLGTQLWLGGRALPAISSNLLARAGGGEDNVPAMFQRPVHVRDTRTTPPHPLSAPPPPPRLTPKGPVLQQSVFALWSGFVSRRAMRLVFPPAGPLR